MTLEERFERIERCWQQERDDLAEAQRLKAEIDSRRTAEAELACRARLALEAVVAKWKPLLEQQRAYVREAELVYEEHHQAMLQRSIDGWEGGAA